MAYQVNHGGITQGRRPSMTDQTQSIGELRQQMRLLWAQACNWDGIHPSSPMVVFSNENPYQEKYDRAYRAWRTLKYPTEKEE